MVYIRAVEISVTDAKAQLTELVRRAEAGDEVVLTRHGQPAARIVAAHKFARTPEERMAAMRAVQVLAAKTATPGPSAARSQDYLYDENGLPG